MSILSHYNAIINIYTYKNIPNFQQLVETAIKHAPQITGSEGNCKMLLINFQSYGSYSYNCGACPYFDEEAPLRELNKDVCCGLEYAGEYLDKLPCNKYHNLFRPVNSPLNSCELVILSSHGLRDKKKEKTQEEFKALIKYLKAVYCKTFEIEILCKNID